MTETPNTRTYDLEDRTFRFAQQVRAFVKLLPRTQGNNNDAKQLIRASGSVGANYIEANEALSKKDFLMRMKISRKEAKEARYWLRLLDLGAGGELGTQCELLVREASELLSIFSAIVTKTE
ncbi:MAG TPA: four helix bundle protein [Phycisphaerae bacterium]|nr:four helix bundle protein [Phycisphaerae bacterium]